MATVKKSILSNIEVKLTEEKRYCNCWLRLFLGEMRLNVYNVSSSTFVAEFDVLTENLDS